MSTPTKTTTTTTMTTRCADKLTRASRVRKVYVAPTVIRSSINISCTYTFVSFLISYDVNIFIFTCVSPFPDIVLISLKQVGETILLRTIQHISNINIQRVRMKLLALVSGNLYYLTREKCRHVQCRLIKYLLRQLTILFYS